MSNRLALRFFDAANFQAELGILLNCAMGEKREVLKDHREMTAAALQQRFFTQRGDVLSVDDDLAFGSIDQAIQTANQRGFTRARQAHDD